MNDNDLYQLPTNAANELLSRTTRNLMICIGVVGGVSGPRIFPALRGGETTGPERAERGGNDEMCALAQSTSTRTNLRRHAGVGKKNPTG